MGAIKTVALGLTAVVALTLASGSATAEEDAQGTAEFGIGTALSTAVVIGKAATSVLSSWNDEGDGTTPPVVRNPDPAPRAEPRGTARGDGGS